MPAADAARPMAPVEQLRIGQPPESLDSGRGQSHAHRSPRMGRPEPDDGYGQRSRGQQRELVDAGKPQQGGGERDDDPQWTRQRGTGAAGPPNTTKPSVPNTTISSLKRCDPDAQPRTPRSRTA